MVGQNNNTSKDPLMNALRAEAAKLFENCDENYPQMCRAFKTNPEGLINRLVDISLAKDISLQKALKDLNDLYTKPLDL